MSEEDLLHLKDYLFSLPPYPAKQSAPRTAIPLQSTSECLVLECSLP